MNIYFLKSESLRTHPSVIRTQTRQTSTRSVFTPRHGSYDPDRVCRSAFIPFLTEWIFSGFRHKSGFTLLEMIVAVGIFSVVVLSSTAIFQQVIISQRMAIATQNTQESLRYVFSVISKEVRTAQTDDAGTCTGSAGSIYVIAGDDSLRFLNQDGDCVSYDQIDGRFKISRVTPGQAVSYLPITPDEIIVSNLTFSIDATDQPAVTISTTVYNNSFGDRDLYKSQMKLQTTISSRSY